MVWVYGLGGGHTAEGGGAEAPAGSEAGAGKIPAGMNGVGCGCTDRVGGTLQKEEELKRRLAVKLELARFLQV